MLFTTAAGLVATLGKALAEDRLDERLKLLAQPCGVSKVYEAPAQQAISEFAWQRDEFIEDSMQYVPEGREGTRRRVVVVHGT